MNFTLPQNSFQGDAPVEISLPDNWDVTLQALPGDSISPLTRDQIRRRLQTPYGSPPLEALARSAREVCIVFDDVSRGTPTRIMAECVLQELLQSGVKPGRIRFLCALGTHGANNRIDFVHKLGEEIVRRYPVYNHNCYENNVRIGTTRRGFDVCVNAEFMRCDLRVGLGAITPHTMNAFGGGAKMLVPGIASIDTIRQNHVAATRFFQENHLNSASLLGDLRVGVMRAEIEEMCRMAGQFFKVDCLYNSRLELLDLYAGDPIEAYYAAIPAARRLYTISRVTGQDVVIVNANAKATEATIASGLGALELKKSGGDVVIIDHTKMGQVTHYLFGSFGRYAHGSLMGGMPVNRPEVERYLCWMPYPDVGGMHWIGETDKQYYTDTWEQTLALLLERHGPGTRAAVITDGTICCFPPEEQSPS